MAIDLYTQAMREAMASAPEHVALIETLELYQAGWAGSVRFVNALKYFSAGIELGAPRNAGETVEFSPFRFYPVRPKRGNYGTQQMQIRLDNVGLGAFRLLRQTDWTQGKIEAIFRVYTTSDLTQPGEYHYTNITGVTVSEKNITASCVFANYLKRAFPSKTYDAVHWPGVHV